MLKGGSHHSSDRCCCYAGRLDPLRHLDLKDLDLCEIVREDVATTKKMDIPFLGKDLRKDNLKAYKHEQSELSLYPTSMKYERFSE